MRLRHIWTAVCRSRSPPVPDLLAITRIIAIALVCAAALTGTNRLTRETIQTNETAALRAAIADLLPDDTIQPAQPAGLDRVPDAWQLCGGYLLGRSDARGYSGDIRLLYTLRRSSNGGQPTAAQDYYLVRLAVLGHQETPGITDFLTDPDWLAGFRGARADQIEAISAITGATITSVAVRDHLAAVLEDPVSQLNQPLQMDCGE